MEGKVSFVPGQIAQDLGDNSYDDYVNINYGYSKTYTKTNPALSAQKDPIEKEKYTWMYKYDEFENETYHLNIGYMFEMNNFNHDLFEGDLALIFDYEFTVKENHFWFPKTRAITSKRYIGYY